MEQKLITQLKILKLSNVKPNFAELARIYDLDWRTVKKYYDGYDGKPKHHSKPSKLDKYKQLITKKLAIKGSNVRAVYEFIIDEVDPNIGTYSNFQKYIKSRGLKPKKNSTGHPRFETEPGVQAQVDWKEDICFISFSKSISESFSNSFSISKSISISVRQFCDIVATWSSF